jgi:HEAT repeat protein
MRMTNICVVICTVWIVISVNAADAMGQKTTGENITYQKLESHQPDDIARAIEQIKKSKHPAGVRALTNRIRNGLPPQLLSLAIDALIEIKSNLAVKTLFELSGHRSHAVRQKIAASLPALRHRETMKVLVKMLDDQNAEVRSQAAIAIGKLKPQSAMNDLIAAAELGVLEASEIVGEHVRPGRVPSLIKMVDDKNIIAFTPLLRELAVRKDIPNNHKLAIVARLDELSTPSSRRLLITLATSLPEWNVVKLAAADVLIKEMDNKEKEKDESIKGESKDEKEELTSKDTKEGEKR